MEHSEWILGRDARGQQYLIHAVSPAFLARVCARKKQGEHRLASGHILGKITFWGRKAGKAALNELLTQASAFLREVDPPVPREDHDWPAFITQIVEDLPITRSGLARHLGCTYRTVYRWERGESNPIGAYREALLNLAAKC